MGAGIMGVAVYPGQTGSLHLTDLAQPRPGPGEALVRVRRVGVCGTDKEIIEAKFGTAPAGAEELVLGHEVLGTVEAVGEGERTLRPGDVVTATVRRPDGCPTCRAGQIDMCLWGTYTERGILGAHGYIAESFTENVRYLVPIPPELEPVGVLVEPLSVVEKAYRQAVLIQRRLAVWKPETAVVLGAGPIGLLGTLLLREQGLAVYTLARTPAPNAASTIVEAAGAHYVSTRETPLAELRGSLPNVDLIFESTGVSALAFAGMESLGINGVLVLLSITGGNARHEIPADAINQSLVLGNKVVVGSVNAAAEDFASGVRRLNRFEHFWPGLAASLITERLRGFDDAHRIAEAVSGGVKTVLEFG